MNKKTKNLSLILVSLIIISCTSTPPNTTNPSVSPTPETPNSTVSNSPSTPIPSATPTPEITPTPIVTPSPDIMTDKDKIKLTNGYIKTPKSAFLVKMPFKLKFKSSVNEIPPKDSLGTFFDLYDPISSPLRSHFSFNIDENQNLILKVFGSGQDFSEIINFPSFELNKEYEYTFLREENKVTFLINGEVVLERTFTTVDFTDLEGRRTLNIGANAGGNNLLKSTFSYFEVEDILKYDFNQNLSDSKKFRIDGIGTGEYEFLKEETTPEPTSTPSETPTPTSSPTNTPASNVETTNTSGQTKINLNVDKDQNSGSYTSPGFDFRTEKALSSERGDLRFITNINGVNYNIYIAGSANDPKVLIVDLGEKLYGGVTDLTKVNFENSDQFFSNSNVSSLVELDHIYAIKTYRYGSTPRYAKIKIDNIITEDYVFERIAPPTIDTQPTFVDKGFTTNFNTTTTYQYYVTTYDGNGETEPRAFDSLGPDANANNSYAKFSFTLPYRAKGYSIYRKEGNKIYKSGPFLGTSESNVTYEDKGTGFEVDKLPSVNTTTKSGYKPDLLEKVVEVEFTYSFDGDGDAKF